LVAALGCSNGFYYNHWRQQHANHCSRDLVLPLIFLFSPFRLELEISWTKAGSWIRFAVALPVYEPVLQLAWAGAGRLPHRACCYAYHCAPLRHRTPRALPTALPTLVLDGWFLATHGVPSTDNSLPVYLR
jgi:hypothetical protein